MGTRYATMATHSGRGGRLLKLMAYYRYTIVDYVDRDFETYVQGRGKLSRHCTSRSKMESIHTRSRMYGLGSHELVEELKKETQKED